MIRVGQGYDVHRFSSGDFIILGGVKIPYHQGLEAHSDGDVVLHALADALLGAAALGDIGQHFPDTDPAFKGADSRALLRYVYKIVQEKSYQLINADITIIAQAPKMSPHTPAMCANIAADLQVGIDCINVKATTTEKLGFEGRKEGIAVQAIVLIEVKKMTRKLHIGGKIQSAGWEILNANPAPYVDHVCNANNLPQFADNTFTEIYASHIVEHLDYNGELQKSLKEWNRILIPGGKIYISVPDLDILAQLMLEKDKLTINERFQVMRMIFGGHIDKYDYHVVGLNQEFLASFLSQTGYVNLKRVGEFGLFNDISSMIFKGVLISLNMTAEKPL
jgi:2-C-methyl-D-erythritol 2,4-cyclodiphosphate synthase